MSEKTIDINKPGATVHPAVLDFVCETMNEDLPCTMEVKNERLNLNGTVTLVKAYIASDGKIRVETRPSGNVTAEDYELDSVFHVVTQIRLKDKVSK